MMLKKVRAACFIGLSMQALVGCGAQSESSNDGSTRGQLQPESAQMDPRDAMDPPDVTNTPDAMDTPDVTDSPEATDPGVMDSNATATVPEGSSVEEGIAILTPEGDLSPRADLIFVGSWSNALAPAACVQGLSNPIAGCDPMRDHTWDLDCDADGVADHVAYDCNPADTERGPAFTGRYDCAPEDPAFSIWVASDRDGDGAIGNAAYNCASNPIPAGYVRNLGNEPNDCDDESSSVFPAAIDTWNDGLDSDCGNGDAPACPVLGAGSTFPRAALALGTCAGADLHIVDLATCTTTCSPVLTHYFLVTNSGAEASPAGLSVSWTDNEGVTGALELPALAAGQASDAFAVAMKGSGQISVDLDFDDCTPGDTQLTKDREFRQCLR